MRPHKIAFKALRGDRGVSLLETMVSLVILGIGMAILANGLSVQRTAAKRAEMMAAGQKYEGLLRAQLYQMAKLEIENHAHTGECSYLSMFEKTAPTIGPKFVGPEITPWSTVTYMIYANSVLDPDYAIGLSDSTVDFARKTGNYCAHQVSNYLSNLRHGHTGIPESFCFHLENYTNPTKALEYIARVDMKYYDFSSQREVACSDWLNTPSPGLKIDYSLVWVTNSFIKVFEDEYDGTVRRVQYNVTAKSGFLEVQ